MKNLTRAFPRCPHQRQRNIPSSLLRLSLTSFDHKTAFQQQAVFTLSNLGTHHLDARVLALLQLAETLLLLQLLLLLNVARNGQIELRDAVLQLASLLELGLGFGAGLRR